MSRIEQKREAVGLGDEELGRQKGRAGEEGLPRREGEKALPQPGILHHAYHTTHTPRIPKSYTTYTHARTRAGSHTHLGKKV
jgi:hypothetical protein